MEACWRSRSSAMAGSSKLSLPAAASGKQIEAAGAREAAARPACQTKQEGHAGQLHRIEARQRPSLKVDVDRLGKRQQALDQLEASAPPHAGGLELGVVVFGAFELCDTLPRLQHEARVLPWLELIADAARGDLCLGMAQEADSREQVDRFRGYAGARHAHGGLHLQEAAHPGLRQLDLLLEPAPGAGGAHLHALRADAEGGRAAGAQLPQAHPTAMP